MHDVWNFQVTFLVTDFHIAIYQPIVMPYQARCYGISALRQVTRADVSRSYNKVGYKFADTGCLACLTDYTVC